MLSEFVARAEGEASAEHRRATALENLVFNAAGHCIVTTGAMKEKVVGYGVPEERVSVIPNYVDTRSEEHTSELQSLMRTSSAVFCVNKKTSTLDRLTAPLCQRTQKHQSEIHPIMSLQYADIRL